MTPIANNFARPASSPPPRPEPTPTFVLPSLSGLGEGPKMDPLLGRGASFAARAASRSLRACQSGVPALKTSLPYGFPFMAGSCSTKRRYITGKMSDPLVPNQIPLLDARSRLRDARRYRGFFRNAAGWAPRPTLSIGGGRSTYRTTRTYC